MNGDFSSKLDKILSNPAMMAQIKSLADTMTETEGAPASEVSPPPAAEPSEPPAQEEQEKPDADIQTETALPASFSPAPGLARNLKNTRALLAALKPYLDDKRREKVDKMLSMMRLAEMAGYFKNLM
ncbi:MAG: hypothetical protein DBY04_06640 [Clostridiales bacterium]|nr:MAG: hypothetical protein DBY04_06640 [Clostridiales bacterium]